MMKAIVYLIIYTLMMTGCRQKESGEERPRAISANETVREKWQRSRKAVVLELTGDTAVLPQKIGVYAEPEDATEEERNSIHGTEFERQPKGTQYIPDKTPVHTGDTTAAYRICSPYRPGLGISETLTLHAPFEEWVYGLETGRETKQDRMVIRMRPCHATSMIRLRLESRDMRKILTETSLTGSNIYTSGEYAPYTGEWRNLSGANKAIRLDMDKRMSRYLYIDFAVPPSPHAGEMKAVITADGKKYSASTTLPRLGRGEMTQLNMVLDGERLYIASSWIESDRETQSRRIETADSIAVGDYLQEDGSISHECTSESVATVIETDGRHGKAVALHDTKGLKCFSRERLGTGMTFATADSQRNEGYINPTKASATDENLKIIYTPEMAYPKDCAIGYTDGCLLSQRLRESRKEWEHEEMAASMNGTDGAYIPALGELTKLYYMLNPYEGTPFAPKGFEKPEGVYTSISEHSEDRNYVMDFDTGMTSGNVSKMTRMRLRMFYLF